MKRAAVAAELRKAQAGTLEEKRLALARMKLARLRVAKAKPKAPAPALMPRVPTNAAELRRYLAELERNARRPRR